LLTNKEPQILEVCYPEDIIGEYFLFNFTLRFPESIGKGDYGKYCIKFILGFMEQGIFLSSGQVEIISHQFMLISHGKYRRGILFHSREDILIAKRKSSCYATNTYFG
jgi:hypothetical protein